MFRSAFGLSLSLVVLAALSGCVGKTETTTLPPPKAPGNGATPTAPPAAQPKPAEPSAESPAVEPAAPTEPDPSTPVEPVTPSEPAPTEPVPTEPATPPAPPAASQKETVTFIDEPKEMPTVIFSQGHAATNKVNVGDEFPKVSLPDFDGASHDLASLLGDRATVVILWQANNPYAVYELKDVANGIAAPLADAGVKVVAVNVRDPLEVARAAVAGSGAKYPQLHDADAALFDAVATSRLPRTYLLDADGKILWFDLEYSQETHRHLLQAVHHLMKQ